MVRVGSYPCQILSKQAKRGRARFRAGARKGG